MNGAPSPSEARESASAIVPLKAGEVLLRRKNSNDVVSFWAKALLELPSGEKELEAESGMLLYDLRRPR